MKKDSFMKKIRYIFDVDGTLTPSRQKMDPEFKKFFLQFIEDNKVWLVTGSDYAKTKEQLGSDITENVVTCYNCSGNETRHRGKIVNASGWKLPEECRRWLSDELIRSPFVLRTGNHLEERRGTCNFSVVGRNATLGERKLYIKYDEINNERRDIVNTFIYVFGIESLGISAVIGGETGIDIYPIGNDKSQVLQDFNEDDNIHFFGDKMDNGGNDYPLAKMNKCGTNHHVKNWEETYKILREEQ